MVGYSENEDDRLRAFLWKSDQFYDLNDLISADSGWALWYASDINDRGEITGYGTLNDGPVQGFVLHPIPEPVTLALVGVAMCVSAGRRRPSIIR